MSAQTPWTKASAELRVTWEALANIVGRVAGDAAGRLDRLEGLRMIGIDEKSWGKGADKYLTVVTDHRSGKIAWITEGRSQQAVGAFFDALGPERSKLLTHVSADGAEWIHDVARAPQALICLDAFHAEVRVLCRIPEFSKLAKTLTRFRELIYSTLDGGPSNGRAEALNAQINALITRARGFRSAAALIAMANYVHGGLCPDSPY